MVTGTGLLISAVLDTTALVVTIEEDGSGETKLSSFLHPVKIMNDAPQGKALMLI